MIARPSAKFARPRVHVSLIARPYERRSVCVLSVAEVGGFPSAKGIVKQCNGGNHTHFTRQKVKDAVQRGEMRWCDKFHNTATFTETASGTWQKTQSGPVCAMQLKVGFKGRHVPAGQREPELVLA